jgi:O-antigen ligase
MKTEAPLKTFRLRSIASSFGFGTEEHDYTYFPVAATLACALAALPVLLHALVDTDRALPLAFLPAVWTGWKLTKAGSKVERWLLVWAIVAMAVSAAVSPHSARAIVMSAAVGWTIAGAAVARNLASCRPAVRLVLLGAVAGAVAGFVMVRLGIGAKTMFFPTYWSARLFGAHQFIGCVAVLPLLLNFSMSRALRMVTVAAAFVEWTGLAWSGSRAPAIGMFAYIGFFVLRCSGRSRRALILWAIGLTTAALPLSYALGNPFPQLGWWDAVTRTAESTGIAAVTSERSNFWAVTWRDALTSPWIGHGADAYLYIHPKLDGNQPHNVLLQWFLEYGIFGMLPFLLLVARAFWIPVTMREDSSSSSLSCWGPAAVAGSAVYGLFDGVFYHAIVFMPVAVFCGISLGQSIAPHVVTSGRKHTGWRILLLGGLVLLILHNWLYLVQLRGRGFSPTSAPARILRAFPSSTYALRNWLEQWRREEPDVAMEWIHWAQDAAIEQSALHVYAAQLYIWQKDYRSAERELLACLEKAHYSERADILNVLANVRRLAKEQAARRNAGDSNGALNTPAQAP